MSSLNAVRGQLDGSAPGIVIRTLSMRGEVSGLPLSKSEGSSLGTSTAFGRCMRANHIPCLSRRRDNDRSRRLIVVCDIQGHDQLTIRSVESRTKFQPSHGRCLRACSMWERAERKEVVLCGRPSCMRSARFLSRCMRAKYQ